MLQAINTRRFYYIPVILQNAIFTLLIFSPKEFLKTHNRMGYSSFLKSAFSKTFGIETLLKPNTLDMKKVAIITIIAYAFK